MAEGGEMMDRFRMRRLVAAMACLIVGMLPVPSAAQMLEDVDAEVVAADKGIELRVHFNVPIHYLRHVPSGDKASETVEIFFKVVSTEGLKLSAVDEKKKVLPFKDGPRFSIILPRNDNPFNEARVLLNFETPTQFRVRQGADGRSIVLELPGIRPPKESAATPVSEKRAAMPEQPVAPSVGAMASVVAPSVVVAETAKPALPVPAEIPASTTADAATKTPPPQASPEVVPEASKTPSAHPSATSMLPPSAEQVALDDQAAKLMAKARQEVAGQQVDAAIDTLNQLLNLPPNAQSRLGQELIARTRDQAGQTAKAQAEYSLFVQLYPTGEDSDRARQRLAELDEALKAPAPGASAKDKTKPAGPAASQDKKTTPRIKPDIKPQWRVFGGLSSYYYWGATKYEIESPVPGTSDFTTSTTDRVDSRSWMNAFDLTARYQDKNWDDKFVLRDSDTFDALGRKDYNDPSQKVTSSRNRLSAAYGEIRNRPDDWLVRAGRQSTGQYSITGIMNRFDGVLAGWGITPKIRINAAAGDPSSREFNPLVAGALGKRSVDYYYSSVSQPFVAASIDVGQLLGNSLSGSVYAIEQKADDYVSRRALGLEARFFKPRFNLYSMLDYDIYYDALNIFMAQGNYIPVEGSSLHFFYDRRRSPLLQLTNALWQVPEQYSTLEPLVNAAANGVDGVKRNALNSTMITESLSIGGNRQLNQRWQMSLDASFSRSIGTPRVDSLTCGSADTTLYPQCFTTYRDAVEDSASSVFAGDKSLSLSLVGNNFRTENDVLSLGLSYMDSEFFSGLAPYVSYHVNLQRLSYDGSLRVYSQRTSGNSSSTALRWSPTFRISYRLQDNLNLEGDAGVEYSTDKQSTVDGVSTTVTVRRYLSMGMRWNF